MGLKRIVLLALLALLAVGFCGCKKKEAPPAGDGGIQKMAEQMKEQAKETGETAKEAMAEAKDDFIDASQKQINQLKDQFSALKARADSEGADAQKKYNEMKVDFDIKMDAASRRLDQLKSTSAEVWMDTKAGLSDAIDDLNEAYDDAADRFTGRQ